MNGLYRRTSHQAGTDAGQLFSLDHLSHQPRTATESQIRAACASAYLGDDTAVCRVLGRYKLLVDTQDLDFTAHLLLDGFWEMWVTQLAPAFVRPGMRAIDVGANVGYYTVLLADLVGPTGSVQAFEPNPPIAARLKRNVGLNGFDDRTQVHACGLWDVDGQLGRLETPERRAINAYVAAAGPVAGKVRPGQCVVPLRRLDALGLSGADFIKIDAEGAEEAIWRGMAGLLERPAPMTVFLEYAAGRYADPAGFLAEILRYGFQLGRVEPGRGATPIGVQDALAHPPTRDQMLVLRR